MDLNQNYPNTNIEMVPRSSEDDQNSNKTGPALNSQDYIPKEYNNPDFQQNSIPQDPNNPDYRPQDTPYNSNQSQQINPAQPNTTDQPTPYCPKCALLVMAIIQFLFVIIEIIVLSCEGWMGMVTIHIDEVLIIGIAIIFSLSSFDKININPVIRTLLFIVVMFAGIILRIFSFSRERFGPLFALMAVRIFTLFPSIPVSVLTSMNNPNSSIQFTTIHSHHHYRP
jgi:hypothetical protein